MSHQARSSPSDDFDGIDFTSTTSTRSVPYYPRNSVASVLKVSSPLYQAPKSASSTSQGYNFSHNPTGDIWRKIEEAKNKHAKFLQKIDATELKALQARFVDPSISAFHNAAMSQLVSTKDSTTFDKTKMEMNEVLSGSFLGSGIPWQKRDGLGATNNPEEERRKVFGLFKMTGGSVPETPLISSQEQLLLQQNQRRVQQIQRRAQPGPHHVEFDNTGDDLYQYEQGSAANAPSIPDRDRISKSPFAHVSPKVDTGLSQMRKPPEKYTRDGVPIVDKPHHPLTIGSRLPRNFKGQINYETFRAQRAKQIAEVTARLYPGGMGQKKQDRRYREITGDHRSQDHTNRPLGIYTQMYGNNNRSNRQVEVLRPPGRHHHPTDHEAPHQHSTMTFRHDYSYGHGARRGGFGRGRGQYFDNPMGKDNGNKSDDDAASTSSRQMQKYKPAQLLPLHVPGPKYDNIYITTYSGADSDRERESDDDMAGVTVTKSIVKGAKSAKKI